MEREVVLETPRLVLTTWDLDDVDALWEVHSDPETMKYVRHGRPETRVETEALVAAYISEHDARGWSKWRLVDHEGVLIGRAGFGSQGDDREIAYTIRRSQWGRGLATEVAQALVEWHLAHTPELRLRGTAVVGNDASIRVLEKVGFLEVGMREVKGALCRVFLYPAEG